MQLRFDGSQGTLLLSLVNEMHKLLGLLKQHGVDLLEAAPVLEDLNLSYIRSYGNDFLIFRQLQNSNHIYCQTTN
jgi:hypothetical protein